MKNFTKLFCAAALFMMGAVSASAQERLEATFANPGKTNAEWDSSTSSFTWTAGSWNQIRPIGMLPYENVNGQTNDISDYKKLVLEYEIIDGDAFRVLFYQGGSNIAAWINGTGAYRNAECTSQISATSNGIVEIPIYEFLSESGNQAWKDFILKCTDICPSGWGNSGQVKITKMYLEPYASGEQKPNITEDEEEQKPDKPEGYVDLTQDMFPNGAYNLEKKVGNGDMIYGVKSKDAFVDLSAYSELLIVGTPGMKVVLNFNHNVDVKENSGDYTEDDPNDYVWIDGTLDADGKLSIDLTQWEGVANLNNIRMPWDNNNRGYVWYLLLKESGAAPVVPDKPQGYIDITSDLYQEWDGYGADASPVKAAGCEINTNKVLGGGSVIFGTGSANYLQFADLSNYSEIAVVADKGMIIRFMFNRVEPEIDEETQQPKDGNGGAYIEEAPTVGEDNIVSVDLTAQKFTSFAHLNAIKIPWVGSASGKVYYILLKEKTATGIDAIEATQADNTIYDLQGRRVTKAVKGVYVIDGKKVIR